MAVPTGALLLSIFFLKNWDGSEEVNFISWIIWGEGAKAEGPGEEYDLFLTL